MLVIFCLFVFVVGSCIGSFLNVLIYRLPLGISTVSPRSHCPQCKHIIAWYDNIPMISWLLLGRACRHCREPIPPIYPPVEFITGLVFLLIFVAYMVLGLRHDMPTLAAPPLSADWAILALYLWLIAALLAASVIDLQRSVIPLPITSLTVAVALGAHGVFPQSLLWDISGPMAALTLGGCLGLTISAVLLRLGIFRYTFPTGQPQAFVRRPRRRASRNNSRQPEPRQHSSDDQEEPAVNPRRQILHEILYLTPPLALGFVAWLVLSGDTSLAPAWQTLMHNAHLNSLAASLFGFLVGGALVWFTRILGTLGFGREAMGLGDVHLMAASGAVLGWLGPVLAFFIAPFFGLLAVLLSVARRRSGELPYGPWLSLGILTVMLFQDKMWAYIGPGLENLWQLLVAA